MKIQKKNISGSEQGNSKSPIFKRASPLVLMSFLSFFLVMSPVKADYVQCVETWSEGFDLVTEHVIDNSENGLTVFLTQNQVAPQDMWAAYRQLSLYNECYLSCVCYLTQTGGKGDCSQLSQKNILGAAVPSTTAMCPLEAPSEGGEMGELFQSLYDLPFSEQCTFEAESSEITKLYSLCNSHKDLKISLFNTLLDRVIWQDVGRKIVGNFAVRVQSISEKFADVQNDLTRFVTCANGIFGQLCTQSNTDTK